MNNVTREDVYSLAEKMLTVARGLVLEMENFIPTAIIFSDNENPKTLLFHVKNDDIEEDIAEIADEIKETTGFQTIVLINEIWLGDEHDTVRPLYTKKHEGVQVLILSSVCAVCERFQVFRSDDNVTFGEPIRFDVTNKDVGMFQEIYEIILNQNHEANLQNAKTILIEKIRDIKNYAQSYYSSCPDDVQDISMSELTGHLLMEEAIKLFHESSSLSNQVACLLFLRLKEENILRYNVDRILYYYLGLMYKYGIFVKKDKYLAIDYFLKCIGKSDSKNGYVIYRKGDDDPIEVAFGLLDNFIKNAKIEIGSMML